jgi:hypothetical protein
MGGVGGGAIVLDYDQDGRMDLVVVDGTGLSDAGDRTFDDAWRTRVFRNLGGLKFEETTKKAGVDLQGFGIGGAACDYDSDGRPDFLVCGWGCTRLYRNQGDGTFADVTAQAGLVFAPNDVCTGCCFGDVDGDGVVDLYVSTYLDQQAFIDDCRREGKPARRLEWRGVPVYTGPTGMNGQADHLFMGRDDGTFVDATATRLGKQDPPLFGFQPVMTDVDDDGDLDVYVANDLGANYLWVNDGRGKFKDAGIAAGCALDASGRAQAGMGVDAADVNCDGKIDLVVTNLDFDHNTLYLNRTTTADRPRFDDVSAAANVSKPSYLHVSWGVKLLDYDGDGVLDLFASCGHIFPEADQVGKGLGISYRQRCLLERGLGPPSYAFADVTDAAGPALRDERVWRGAVFADFDDDGDTDVFLTALNDRAALWRNDVGNRNEWVSFRLVGDGRPRDPCGARVTVLVEGGLPRMQELHHGASFCSDNDPRLLFGLGKEKVVRRVDVRWPNGRRQTFKDVAAGRRYVIEQGKDAPREDKR